MARGLAGCLEVPHLVVHLDQLGFSLIETHQCSGEQFLHMVAFVLQPVRYVGECLSFGSASIEQRRQPGLFTTFVECFLFGSV